MRIRFWGVLLNGCETWTLEKREKNRDFSGVDMEKNEDNEMD